MTKVVIMSWAQNQFVDPGDVCGECMLASSYLGRPSLSPILMHPFGQRAFMLQRTSGNGSGRQQFPG